MAKAKYELHIEQDNADSELVLMKFPAMRSQFETRPESQINLQVKPKSMKFKLEVSLNCKAADFSPDKALALGTKSNPKVIPGGFVNKNFYTSSMSPIEEGQLFVCRTVDNKIICRPVSHLVAMRSDLSHLDLKDEVDPKEEVRPVSMKFATPDRAAAAAKTASQEPEIDETQDEYLDLRYKSRSSNDASHAREEMFGKKMPLVKPDPDAEPVEEKPPIPFIPDVKPKIRRCDTEYIYSKDFASLPNSSAQQIAKIKQLVKDCLMKAKVASFEEIYHYVSDKTAAEDSQLSNKDIIDSLNELALLVQGNWSIKSEILCGDSSVKECTDVTGVSINLFIAARDYLLWLFNQNRFISRIQFSKRVKMPDHDIMELFQQLSYYRPAEREWEFKLPTDTRFIEKFPDIVQRQATFWKVRRANKLSIFHD